MFNEAINEAINEALSGASNEDCVKILVEKIPERIKNANSDVFANHLSILISAFAFKIYPIRKIGAVESDRLLLLFSNRSATLRLIRKEKKDAEEFGAALDALGIPKDKAYMALSYCEHVLKEGACG
jgi:hypothetical protein